MLVFIGLHRFLQSDLAVSNIGCEKGVYSVTGSGNAMHTTYNEPGLSLNYANGGLDTFGRVISHAWMKGMNPLVHILHDYDYAGNRTSRLDAVHAANSEVYTYDAVNQIKSLNRGNSAFTESWNFDKTGNWTQYNRHGTIENRTHNAANEIATIGGVATNVASDKNGNMTKVPKQTGVGFYDCVYDAWNRLVQVKDGAAVVATYTYNGANQRIKKTAGNAVTTSFFNENWQELESITAGQVTSFVWGVRYIDDLILREKGVERLYSLADPNWNVVATTNAAGVVQERMKYDAFGKVTWLDAAFAEKANSGFAWNRTFTGQVLDNETGLMLYRNRYYHTGLGRFVSRDPIGYEAGDINIYRTRSRTLSAEV